MGMDLQEKLENKIDELKNFISNFDVESVLYVIGNDLNLMYDGKDIFKDTKLSSPHQQYMYLAGLIISTDSKDNIIIEKKDFEKAKQMLEEIIYLYADSFFPTKEEIEKNEQNKKWYNKRQVSMSVFLDYFNTSELNYEEQQEARIKRWFEPFNDYFKNKFNFSVDELLEIYSYIVVNLRKQLSDLYDMNEKLKKEQKSFFLRIQNGISEEEAVNQVYIKIAENFKNLICNFNRIFIKDLKYKFGEEMIDSFLNIFSLKREKRKFRYYTEKNPFELSPLLRKDNEYIFCCAYKQLLNAIYVFLYEQLENSKRKNQFYKRRDSESEKETEELLKRIFGDKANYFPTIFEKNDSNNEHDLLVEYKDNLIICEVKASKVKEPFRNPDKAYVRIERDFKSDRGIQKAYEQGLRLKKLILSQDETTLYDKYGNIIVNINKNNYKKIYIFCITAENYSVIATHLPYLLEKEENEPYPWSCNLYDLETICNAFEFKKLYADKFLNYIDERSELQEVLIASDELDICGFYLRKGSLNKIKTKLGRNNEVVICMSGMSDIFDNIYYKQKGIDINNISLKNKNLLNKSKRKNKNKKNRKMRKLSKKRNRKK